MKLLTSLGSTLELHAHFLDTGDFCEGSGANDPWATAEQEEDGGPEAP